MPQPIYLPDEIITPTFACFDRKADRPTFRFLELVDKRFYNVAKLFRLFTVVADEGAILPLQWESRMLTSSVVRSRVGSS
jgi:hypothetical protein